MDIGRHLQIEKPRVRNDFYPLDRPRVSVGDMVELKRLGRRILSEEGRAREKALRRLSNMLEGSEDLSWIAALKGGTIMAMFIDRGGNDRVPLAEHLAYQHTDTLVPYLIYRFNIMEKFNLDVEGLNVRMDRPSPNLQLIEDANGVAVNLLEPLVFCSAAVASWVSKYDELLGQSSGTRADYKHTYADTIIERVIETSDVDHSFMLLAKRVVLKKPHTLERYTPQALLEEYEALEEEGGPMPRDLDGTPFFDRPVLDFLRNSARN